MINFPPMVTSFNTGMFIATTTTAMVYAGVTTTLTINGYYFGAGATDFTGVTIGMVTGAESTCTNATWINPPGAGR